MFYTSSNIITTKQALKKALKCEMLDFLVLPKTTLLLIIYLIEPARRFLTISKSELNFESSSHLEANQVVATKQWRRGKTCK